MAAVSDLLWHWWEGHSFWEVWKRVNQVSLLDVIVEEGAAFTEWALAFLFHVFAWLSLVV